MNNNIDTANFDRMLELAEFGAKRHDQRRQIVFRIAVAYLTLLVLALYQTIKNENLLRLDVPWLIIYAICLVVVHIFYVRWQQTAFIAMINDVRRRDFYLMKAQIIAYYLTQSRFSSFNPDPCEKMIVNFASETVWETNERSLFKEREPTMIHRKTSSKKPGSPNLFKDTHFLMLIIGPTAIAFLLFCKLIGMIWPWGISIILARVLLISNFLLKFGQFLEF